MALLPRSQDDDIWAGLVARKHMQLPTADAWLKMVASADINTRTQRVRTHLPPLMAVRLQAWGRPAWRADSGAGIGAHSAARICVRRSSAELADRCARGAALQGGANDAPCSVGERGEGLVEAPGD